MINSIVKEKEISFNRLEKEIYKAACKMACDFLSSILETMDNEISQKRDKKEYRDKGKRKTTLKTLMGEVIFSRRVYEHINEEGKKTYVYLLDQELDFDTIGFISTNLAEKVVENACISSFRNTAKNITELTGQSISHGGAWNIVQTLGKKIKEREEKQVEALENNQIIGQKEVPLLFEEADGVYINIQGKDRPKSGKKLEMKVAVAYEGWKEVGKDKYELVNKIACVGFEEASKFNKTKEAMIAREYNTDEIEMRILNGDGAAWIKQGIDDTLHYQLDPFHKYQALVRSLQDRNKRKRIRALLDKNKIEEALEYIQILADSVEDEKEEKKLRELYRYFNNNKEGLIPYQSRGLEIPEPHDKDIIYRTLGTMEHHICDIIAQRMKNRKASWSIEGAGNLGKILAAKASKKLHEIIEQYSKITLSEEKSREIIEILSAAKAPKKDGKGKDGNIHKGQIPFNNCYNTNGRKAIRNIFKMKSYSDLTYR